MQLMQRISRIAIRGVLGACVLVAASVQTASAQAEIDLRIVDSDATDKDNNPAPEFLAIIKGALPGLTAEAFALRQDTADPPVTIPSNKVTPYVKSNDKAAIVILIEGNGRWMGNETYAEDEGEVPEAGAFTGLGAAVDNFQTAGPPGSVAAVLLYGDGKSTAKYEMGDASKVNGGVLGQQKDYASNLDIPLLAGLKDAINLLDKYGGYRRVLVVIGDGTGERDDIAGDLNARVEELKARKIELYSIFYEAIPSGDGTGQANMNRLGATKSYVADSKDSIATYTKAIVEEMSNRYYVSFPGCGEGKSAQCFMHDGELHEFVLLIQDEEQEPVELQTRKWDPPKPPKETSLWWLWLLLGLTGVGLVGFLVYKKLQSREVIVQPPMQEFEQPEMQAPAAPAAPAKTIMLNAVGGDDSMPMVGWIVPLEGPNQYQTFKLLQGVTIIGSGGNSNIVIQDGYMSAEHAQIVASPTGFVLNDGGSTNGSYVNDQRVSSHELVDNDVFTMGKTNFKFKSIN